MATPLTLKAAKRLVPGDILYSLTETNSDGTPQRWKVSGWPKLWKTDPGRIEIPLKRGLYAHARINQHELAGFSRTPGRIRRRR